MNSSDGWGWIFLLVGCPCIGGIPITGWITSWFAGKNLAELGTRNVGVSAAFYHGGTWVGLLAVVAEAAKGLGVVYGARRYLPPDATWELAALIALVMGRYWMGRGAGTTNVVWGILAYHWQVALCVLLIGGGSVSFMQDRRAGRWLVLIVLPVVVALLRQDLSETLMAIALSGVLAWIYLQLSDDLALSAEQAQSQAVFQLLRGDRALVSLERPLDAQKVGQKAANLAQLKAWGYRVPTGWVLPPGDDAEPLVAFLNPTSATPLVVRSSAMGEDSDSASSAGQYQTVLQVTSRAGLRRAIAQCQDCYDDPTAAQYRQDRGVPEGGMSVIVQVQIQGQFSGVAFSRDPISGESDAVAIEGLPGAAINVVSGQQTPERYWVQIPTVGQSSAPTITGTVGQIPSELIEQVALLVRDIEARYHGVPQDLEWTFDGQTLWVLQTRPITTLTPIWTRRIAAEVIPGVIHPLTWSINHPLTCGVWADLFRWVLGQRAAAFNVRELATLHYGHAYFNATLLEQLFRRMGLPGNSLEFLIRGGAMGRPAPAALVKTLPGLMQLGWQELTLPSSFRRDHHAVFEPLLSAIAGQPSTQLSPQACMNRIDQLLSALRRATFFSILAPISAAVRQQLWRVEDAELDNRVLPEAAALRSLQALARQAMVQPDGLMPDIEDFLAKYGYLSDVATDIAVPTWREHPQMVQDLLQSFIDTSPPDQTSSTRQRWVARIVQRRLALKGQVAEVYSRLLAELRYALLRLEQHGIDQTLFQQSGDLFFLKLSEIREWISQPGRQPLSLVQLIAARRHEFDLAQSLKGVPTVVYGTPPPLSILKDPPSALPGAYHGIGASPGIVEGTVCVLRSLRQLPSALSRDTVLVVPYTDAGWSPLLAQVGGIVSEVGGRLSHGAIIAREYGIPAVMDIAQATQRFKDGQRVRVDGYRGIVEVL